MRSTGSFLLLLLALVLTAGSALSAGVPVSHGLELLLPDAAPAPGVAFLELLLAGALVFGAIRIKDAATLAAKYKTRASAAVTDYKDGVAVAGQDWESNTIANEANYEQGVQAAVTRKAFGKGVRAAGAAHYSQRATELGSTRYANGVAAGQSRWQANTQPYLQALAAMTLPPKGPKRSPQNAQRATHVMTELGKMKETR